MSGKLTRQQGWNNCYCLIAQNILLYASELKKFVVYLYLEFSELSSLSQAEILLFRSKTEGDGNLI